MKVINKKNKTGRGRSPYEGHIPLIRSMLDSGATQLEVSNALAKLGVDRAPNSLCEWLNRRKTGYHRATFEYLSQPSDSLAVGYAASTPKMSSSSLHTNQQAPNTTKPTTSKIQISPMALAALKAKAKKAAEELSNRIPQ